jgi:hypothetical protein
MSVSTEVPASLTSLADCMAPEINPHPIVGNALTMSIPRPNLSEVIALACVYSFLIAAPISHAVESKGVTLVEDGKPKAVIVWDAKAADDRHFGELKPYIEEHLPWAIEQITGAKLQVVTAPPADDTPAILIGKSWLPADLAKRLTQHIKRFDTRMITRDQQRVYLAGGSVRGDAGAVADFIHDVLAVHLYGPEPIQWQIPHQPTLRADFSERIWTPAFVYRRTWYDAQNIPRRGELAENYERFLAITGAGPGMRISTGHAWSRVLPEDLFDQHPEYFAEVKGKRVPRQACISNSEVVERFARHYAEEFEERPGEEAASISPNDGGGYCECANCLAMNQDLSTRLLMFFNEVGRRVARTCPGRYLAFYAYAYNEQPPKLKNLRAETNLIPVLAHFRIERFQTVADAAFDSSQWEWLHERLIPWRSLTTSPHFVLREYIGWWYGPSPMYRSLLSSLRSYAEHGADGITREYQGRDMGVDLYMYLEMRMTTDPYQDGGKLLDAALKEYYGPAWFTERTVSFEIEDALRRGKTTTRAGLHLGYPNRVTVQFLRDKAQVLRDTKATCEEPYRSRLDRDIRYLECSTRFMEFALAYEAAVAAAKKRPPTPDQLDNIRRLLKAWLDNQAALVASGLKGDGYVDRCVKRDDQRISEWLNAQNRQAGTAAPAEKTSSR